MIYQHHPEVGAILHVHAWMEGTRATEINFQSRYPGGSLPPKIEVSSLLVDCDDEVTPASVATATGTKASHFMEYLFLIMRVLNPSVNRQPWNRGR